MLHAISVSDSCIPNALQADRGYSPRVAKRLTWPLAAALILIASVDGWSILALIAKQMF